MDPKVAGLDVAVLLIMLVLGLDINILVVILVGRLLVGRLALLLWRLVVVLRNDLSALLGWCSRLLGGGGRAPLLALQFLKVLAMRKVSTSMRQKEHSN